MVPQHTFRHGAAPPTECNYVHLHSKLEIRPAYCSITSAACDCVSVVIIALITFIIIYKYEQLSHIWAGKNEIAICSGAPRKLQGVPEKTLL